MRWLNKFSHSTPPSQALGSKTNCSQRRKVRVWKESQKLVTAQPTQRLSSPILKACTEAFTRLIRVGSTTSSRLWSCQTCTRSPLNNRTSQPESLLRRASTPRATITVTELLLDKSMTPARERASQLLATRPNWLWGKHTTLRGLKANKSTVTLNPIHSMLCKPAHSTARSETETALFELETQPLWGLSLVNTAGLFKVKAKQAKLRRIFLIEIKTRSLGLS